MKTLKYSRQREAILKNLSQRKDHPTADLLYQSLRTEYPRLSLGTVYRNLNLLAEIGTIRRIDCGGGIERFDFDTSDHYHFVCTCCGRVLDVPMTPISELEDIHSLQEIGTVKSHSVLFYGICNDCRRSGASERKESEESSESDQSSPDSDE